jgi:hypothetical protein
MFPVARQVVSAGDGNFNAPLSGSVSHPLTVRRDATGASPAGRQTGARVVHPFPQCTNAIRLAGRNYASQNWLSETAADSYEKDRPQPQPPRAAPAGTL